jgi:hypothetical protein
MNLPRTMALLITFWPLAPALAQGEGAFGQVIRIDAEGFDDSAGRITFSELPLMTGNPVFYPGSYGAPDDGVVVGFAGYFVGQRIASPGACPQGAVATGCVEGQPQTPLRLASDAPATRIIDDSANPNSPSLSGSPIFNGPVSIVFDRDVAGVGLAGGYFDTPESTAIQAFNRQGQLIGGVRNVGKGMEYMALVTRDGSEQIAGIQFSLVGAESAGFGIDDVTFAFSGQLDRSQIEGLGLPPEVQPLPVPAPPVINDDGPRQFMYRLPG